MQLSPHFSLRELTRSQVAERLGIDNTPDTKAIRNLLLLCENVLEPVRAEWGSFSPSSGYRCPALNRAIGGSERSQHMTGQAADFELPSLSNLRLAHWIADELRDFDQLILEFHVSGDPNSGWVHCSWAPAPRRRSILTFTRDKRQSGGLPPMTLE
jgi:hypothetical protein